MGINIAIDGPAGAGKSTIAKKVAKELSFIYVDTGAMYRAMAFYLLEKGISGDENISKACHDADISIRYENGEQQVILNGKNVTAFLRKEEVGNMASVSSANPEVRAHLLKLQRNLAAENNVVMDGRDIGTTILPNAEVKIFLTASAKTRANRRYLELTEKGEACDMDEILKDIIDRDERDMSRAVSPLKQAEDAVLVDSSEMGIEEGKIREVVIGVGINVNLAEIQEELKDKATSLYLETGKTYDRNLLIGLVMGKFEKNYEKFVQTCDLSLMIDDYNMMLANKCQPVRILDKLDPYEGVALGIDREGELLVRVADGRIRKVCSGEVSVRGLYSYV